jgi:hypothetical protein
LGLFPSRTNSKLPCYISWDPEPSSWKVDAITFPLVNKSFYIFLPFRLIGSVSRKMFLENTRGILISPLWSTQPWFTRAKQWSKDFRLFLHGPFNPLGGIPLLRKALTPYGLDKAMKDRLVSNTWRMGTVTLYMHYICKCQLFCLIAKIESL